MALKSWRWVIGTVAGMLILMTLLLTLREPQRRFAPEQIEGAQLAEMSSLASARARTAALKYRFAVLDDSAHSILARMPATPTRVVIDPRIVAPARPALDRSLEKALLRASSGTAVPIDIFVAYEPPGQKLGVDNSWGLSIAYELPARPGGRCLSIVRLTGNFNAYLYELRRDDVAQEMLGPCLYYHKFGIPGEHVSDWIRDRGARMTLSGSWDADSPMYQAPYSTRVDQSTRALNAMGDEGGVCAAGDVTLCEEIVTHPLASIHPVAWNGLLAVRGARLQYWRTPAYLGSREREFLAGMVRSIGDERFQAFWTSNDSVPAAFQKATGVRFGEWIADWAQRLYGRVESGPSMRPLSVFWAGLLVLLGVVLSVSVARRRVFG
jgi:hypothetical protein